MASDKSTACRDLFGELIEGIQALEASRGGKRTHAVVFKPAPELTPGERGRKRKPRC